LRDRLAVFHQFNGAVECVRRGEEMLVDHREMIAGKSHGDVLVIELDLGHFRRWLTGIGIDDAIAAKIAIIRPIAKIAAIGQVPFAAAIGPEQGLVDIVPDEPALIERIAVGQNRCIYASRRRNCPLHGYIRSRYRVSDDSRPGRLRSR